MLIDLEGAHVFMVSIFGGVEHFGDEKCPRRLCCFGFGFHLADVIEVLLERQLAELVQRQAEETADALVQHAHGLGESRCFLSGSALSRRWIGKSPVCRYGLTRPDGTNFLRGVVAHGKNKIEVGCHSPSATSPSEADCMFNNED